LPTSPTLDLAQKTLATQKVPMPADWMGDLVFPANLLYLHKAAEATLASATAFFEVADAEEEGPETVASEVLKTLGHCLVSAVHAMVVIGAYPPEAEEALESAGETS